MQGLLSHQDSKDFLLAGKSTFTFRNTKTGNRFTYQIRLSKSSKEGNPVHFVKVLTNPDTYQFIGSIHKNRFKISPKSKISSEAQSVLAFNYVFHKLLEGSLDTCVEIWHEGRCGKCGRALTTPESLLRGLGPECAKVINKPDMKSVMRDKKIDYLIS